jgi:hypothetical protein
MERYGATGNVGIGFVQGFGLKEGAIGSSVAHDSHPSCIAFGTILPFTAMGSFLGFVPLPVEYWMLLVLMVATYLFLVDAGKVFFYKICKF